MKDKMIYPPAGGVGVVPHSSKRKEMLENGWSEKQTTKKIKKQATKKIEKKESN